MKMIKITSRDLISFDYLQMFNLFDTIIVTINIKEAMAEVINRMICKCIM